MSLNFFIAEVRNIKDPYKSGRVQIRDYNLHGDEQNIKDEHLPWAVSIMPSTSASTARVGVIPTGLLKGSRVVGLYIDAANQYPLILGSFHRSHEPKDRKPDTAVKGEDGKKDPPGIDSAGSDAAQRGKQANNKNAGGTPVDTSKDKFNYAQFVSADKPVEAIKTARSKHAPNADKPTTASADPSKDLASVLKQVDPNGIAQVFKNLIPMFAKANQTMNLTTPSTIAVTVTDALTGALAILAKKYGIQIVLDVFAECLRDNGITRIDTLYQDIVKEALAKLLQNAIDYGVDNLPYSSVPVVIYHSVNQAVPQPIYGFAPDLYIQQYYPVYTDPYPGFIQWLGPTGDYIYTVRTTQQPPYPDVETAIRTEAEQQLANDLEPFIIKRSLTVQDLNTVLDKNFKRVQNNGIENTLGKNSSQNIMQLLQQLLGILGPIINKTNTNHLPNSVLNQTSVSKSLEKFSKNMGLIKKMKKDTTGAFNLPSALSNLTSLTSGNLPTIPGVNISSINNIISRIR